MSTEERINETQQIATSAERMMDEFYPDWWSDKNNETVCIPASLDVVKNVYLGPTDPQADNYNDMLFNEKKRFYKGQKAEYAFMKIFQKLNLGGVLISGFDSAEYPPFKKIKKNRLREKFGIEDVEIDAIFIHPNIGIFAIEIKSTKKTNSHSNIYESEQYQKAERQLKKIESQIPRIFKQICNGTNFDIPIHLALCFPFEFLNKKREDVIVQIDRSYFLSEEKMKKLFVNRLTFRPENAEHLSGLKKFACAIAGYRSMEFSSAGSNALAVHKIIETQSFGCGTKITESDIFWTNEQLAILECDESRQLICGPPGTGKTLILIQKALRAVLNGKKVYVIAVVEVLRQKFQRYFDNKLGDNDNIIRPVIADIDGLQTADADDHIYVDELPCDTVFLDFLLLRRRNCVAVMTGLVDPLSIKKMKSLVESHQSGLRYFALNTVIRSSKRIFEEWKNEFSVIPIKIGHNCIGPSVERITAFNSSQILDTILGIIVKLKQQIGPNFHSNLAVITDDDRSVSIIHEFLDSNGIKCGTTIEQINNKNTVAVCGFTEAYSLEWPFVIIASLISLDQRQNFALTAVSRCMSKLHVIERDYMSVQAVIGERICEHLASHQQQTIGFQTFFAIVQESGNDFAETKDFVLSYDSIYACIRHNVVLDEILQEIEELRECRTLFDCFAEITRSSILCKWLLIDEDMRKYLANQRTNFLALGNGLTKLFYNLWSNRNEQEKAELLDILGRLHRKLVSTAEKSENKRKRNRQKKRLWKGLWRNYNRAATMKRLHSAEWLRQYLNSIIKILVF